MSQLTSQLLGSWRMTSWTFEVLETGEVKDALGRVAHQFGAGHKKTRPPIGGTPGGLALPDKGRGNSGDGPYPVALI